MNLDLINEIIKKYNLPQWSIIIFAFITFTPFIYRSIKSLFKFSQFINLKKFKKSKELLFQFTAIVMLSLAFTYINIIIKSAFSFFHIDYFYYICFIVILIIIWTSVYILVGFQDPLKLSFISEDLTNYNQYMQKEYYKRKYKEAQFFSEMINNPKYINANFKSIKKVIVKKYKDTYKKSKITKFYTFLINTLVIVGCILNGFLLYILTIAGKDPMIIFICLLISLIFIVQFYHLYKLNVSMKNYDHLKHYREKNNEDDKEG